MSTSEQLPHLVVTGRAHSEPYIRPASGGKKEFNLPSRDRATHGSALLHEIDQARQANEKFRGVTTSPDESAKIILEIVIEEGLKQTFESLEPRSRGVELACIKDVDGVRTAVVHVPEDNLTYFVKLVEQYLTKQVKGGKPKHQPLIDRIAEIRLASLSSF